MAVWPLAFVHIWRFLSLVDKRGETAKSQSLICPSFVFPFSEGLSQLVYAADTSILGGDDFTKSLAIDETMVKEVIDIII